MKKAYVSMTPKEHATMSSPGRLIFLVKANKTEPPIANMKNKTACLPVTKYRFCFFLAITFRPSME
jgi:hypothetical protein